jgi:hypothetical protein
VGKCVGMEDRVRKRVTSIRVFCLESSFYLDFKKLLIHYPITVVWRHDCLIYSQVSQPKFPLFCQRLALVHPVELRQVNGLEFIHGLWVTYHFPQWFLNLLRQDPVFQLSYASKSSGWMSSVSHWCLHKANRTLELRLIALPCFLWSCVKCRYFCIE